MLRSDNSAVKGYTIDDKDGDTMVVLQIFQLSDLPTKH